MKRFALIVGLAAAAGLVGMPVVTTASAIVVNDLPTVETVLNNSVKAVGGRAALDKIKTFHSVMKMSAQGTDMEMDSSWARSGGRLISMKTPIGQMSVGTDGTTAWTNDPMNGYGLARDRDKGQLGLAALLMTVVDPTCLDKAQRAGAKVVSKEQFQGKECFKLSLPKTTTEEGSFMFFDSESGMPVGSSKETGTGTFVFGDWKRIDEVLFFHSITMEKAGTRGEINGELKVTTIEVNKPDESAFALPDAVKKLASEKKADAAAPEIKLEDLSAEDQKTAKNLTQSVASMDTKMLKQMESSTGMGIDHMPPEKKQLMKFYLQEIRKELAKRK